MSEGLQRIDGIVRRITRPVLIATETAALVMGMAMLGNNALKLRSEASPDGDERLAHVGKTLVGDAFVTKAFELESGCLLLENGRLAVYAKPPEGCTVAALRGSVGVQVPITDSRLMSGAEFRNRLTGTRNSPPSR